MEVVRELEACPRPEAGTVVTIGAYDGVHLGHRTLIAEVRQRADALGCASAVVTFDRHPATVVRPESAPLLLTDLDQKLELLATTGVDYTVVVRFDEERARESAEDFVREVLVGCLGARSVVVGHDFHFGHRRRGNVALLTHMGADLGFDVLGLRLVVAPDDEVYSSTRIRRALLDGDVAAAARLLGRPHEVRGAASLGEATRVDVPPDILLPAPGIYAGWLERRPDQVHGAAVTVDASGLTLQLLDGVAGAADDGGPAKVRFVARMGDAADGADEAAVRDALAASPA